MKKDIIISRMQRGWCSASFLILAGVMLALSCTSSDADITNTWEYTNAPNYNVSDSQYIEVNSSGSGTAELILQAKELHENEIIDYTNQTSVSRISFGSKALLKLSGTSGAYAPQGVFTSRVIDGGGFGNAWESIFVKASNLQFENSLAQIEATMPGLVGLWHMNNDWSDSSTNNNDATSVAVLFTNEAAFGEAAAHFHEGGVRYLQTSQGLPVSDAITFSFWLNVNSNNFDNAQVSYAVFLGNSGGRVFGVEVGGTYDLATGMRSHAIQLNDAAGNWSSTISNTLYIGENTNIWTHVVVAYDDNATPRTRIYRDGEELPMYSQNVTGSIGANNQVALGSRPGGAFRLAGSLDEVAIFDRAISYSEVISLYRAGDAVRVKVRSSGDPSTIYSKSFVGPNDDVNAFYLAGVNEEMDFASQFTNLDRYAQYQLDLFSDSGGSETPRVEAVGLYGSQGVYSDKTGYDFGKGNFLSVALVGPEYQSCLGIGKQYTGSYYTNAVFVSRVITNTGSFSWTDLDWDMMGEEIDADQSADIIPYLLGLYHSHNWNDASSHGYNGSAFLSVPSVNAKLGSGSAVFDGVDDYVDSFGYGSTEVRSVEFWINDDNADDAIMTLDTGTHISISNHLIVASGFYENTPVVYVNGLSSSPRLIPAWNHVALVWDESISLNGLTVGRVGLGYMGGMMDEMAVWGKALGSGEIAEHYARGAKEFAGDVKFQVRANDDPGLSGAVWGAEISTPGALGGVSGQYLQYRVNMSGDGYATPGVPSVTLTYWDVGNKTITDDSGDKFFMGNSGSNYAESVRWYGEEMNVHEYGTLGSPNIDRNDYSGDIMALYHMDEKSWGNIIDEVAGNNGSQSGGAYPSVFCKLGSRCGYFDGVDDSAGLGSPSFGANPFTLSLWFNSEATNRCSLVSKVAGGQQFEIELNSDGSGHKLGYVAYIVDTASSAQEVTVSSRGYLNDGEWHNIMAMKNDHQILLYIDGDLLGVTEVGTGYGDIGGGSPTIANGSAGFYKGYIDEVAVFNKDITRAEVGEICGAGASTRESTYVSDTIDALQPAIWQTLSWSTHGIYGSEIDHTDADVMAAWHLNETSGNAIDATGRGHDGAVNGATRGQATVTSTFTYSYSFNGSSDNLLVTDHADLEQPVLTVEGWVYLDAVLDAPLFDKRDANSGYSLGADDQGRAYFWCGNGFSGVRATGNMPLRSGQWHHLAGTYDGNNVRLYVDGMLMDSAVLASVNSDLDAGNAFIGEDLNGNNLGGRIDEVAVWNRALSSAEIADHYAAGVVTLRFQEKAWPSAQNYFVGPGLQADTYFTLASGEDTVGDVPLARYMQYKAYIQTSDHKLAPKLQGMNVDVSSYSSSNPDVQPIDSQTRWFPGRLRSFDDVNIAGNPTAEVEYQISGDSGASPIWYYLDTSGPTQFMPVAAGGYSTYTSDKNLIDQYIDTFYDQYYPEQDINFRVKAFLHSQGDYQIQVDRVMVSGAEGRVVITEPDTWNTGDDAWIIGVTNEIKWNIVGNVSDQLRIRYSTDSGVSWQTIASNVSSGTGRYPWLTPGTIVDHEKDTCRIRIDDMSAMANGAIWDESNGDFQLRHRYHIIKPNGGEKWYTGATNDVVWSSAPGLGANSWLWFSQDSGSNWMQFATAPNMVGMTNNVYPWDIPKTNASFLSENARIAITLQGSPTFAFDASDNDFTLAGIRVTQPSAGTLWKRGNTETLEWTSAGAGAGGVKFEISLDGGASYIVVSNAVPNSAGVNTMQWKIAAPNPSDIAMFRLTANGDTNVWGTSALFTIADVDIKKPALNDEWQVGSTNTIVWTYGGPVSDVNIYYSANGVSTNPADWSLLPGGGNYPNALFPATNSFSWVVPSDPSDDAYIRVAAVVGGETLWAASERFNIAGVRIESPNQDVGGVPARTFNLGEAITWSYAAAGPSASGLVRWSNDGDVPASYFDISTWSLAAKSMVYAPTRPTSRGRAMIVATDSSVTNMFDVSDNDFTVKGVVADSPTNGAEYTLGTEIVNGIQWTSAGVGDKASVFYSADGVGDWIKIIDNTFNDEVYPGLNSRAWTVAMTEDLDPSETAKLRVDAIGSFGNFTNYTPAFIGRGLKFTQPTSNTVFDVGVMESMFWLEAGIDVGATAQFYVSLDGGATYDPTPILPWDVLVGSVNSASWTVAPGTDPTDNAVIKIVITNSPTANDINYEIESKPFTLRGLKFVSPALGVNWELGSTQQVSFLAAGAGTFADIQYAEDGVNFDTVDLVVDDMFVSNGLNTFSWDPIEYSRTPSVNAKLRVVSGSLSAVSEMFTVGGVLVTKPLGTDIWAADETNRIEWISVGTDGTNTIEVLVSNAVVQTISGITGTSYEWAVPSNAVSDDVVIRITDTGGYFGESPQFEVVSEPLIKIISPLAGEFLKVSDTYQIRWSQGGSMTPTFQVVYSTNDFVSSLPISGSMTFSNNIWSMEWNIIDPNKLGDARIFVTNITDVGISDTSSVFYLAPKFDVKYPNGGELLYAKKPTVVKWYTEGNTYAVDLYYSTDILRDPSSWIPIPDNPVTCLGDKQESQYLWSLPDVQSDTVWIRVQDHSYSNMYDKLFSGPYDDCDTQFEIDYYTVGWFVHYVNLAGETNGLRNLSVSDSSGWSGSDLSCKDNGNNDQLIIHEYPYGTYDTAWYREFFSDEVVFQWLCDSHQTQAVVMAASDVEPDYHVMANFTFNSGTTNFSIQSWLERSGSILADPDWSRIEIFNSTGATITVLNETSSANGIFWESWNVPVAEYNDTDVFLAIVQIKYSGQTYSSAMTFQMRQTAGDTEVTANYDVEAAFVYNTSLMNFGIQAWLESSGIILGSPSGCRIEISDNATGTNVATISEVVQSDGLFRLSWDVTGLGYTDSDIFWGQVYITNLTETYSGGFSFQMRQTASDAITNMMGTVDNTEGMVSNVLDDTTSITGTLDTVSTDVSNIDSTLTSFVADTGNSLSNITDDIANARTDIMGAVSNNEALLQTAVSELSFISNELVGVIGPTLTNTANMISNVQDTIEQNLARILTAPDDVELNDTVTILYKSRRNLSPPPWMVVEGTTYSNNMTEIITGMGIYEASVTANWGTNSYRLTCGDPDKKGMDSIILNVVETVMPGSEDSAAILAISNDLQAVDVALASISTMISDDATESSLASVQVSVDDVMTEVTALETMLGTVSTTVDSTADGVGGIQDSIDDVADGVAAVDETVNSIETTVDATSTDVTGIESDMNTVVSTVSSIDSSVSSVESTVSGLDASMSGVEAAMGTVESAVGGMEGSVANVESSVSGLEASIASAESGIDKLAGELAQIGSDASEAASFAQKAKTEAANAATGVEELKEALLASDDDAASMALRKVQQSFTGIEESLVAIPGSLKEAMSDKLTALLTKMSEVSGDKDTYTAGKGGGSDTEPIDVDIDDASMLDLTRSIEEMKGKMKHMEKLLDEAAYKPVVTETLLGSE